MTPMCRSKYTDADGDSENVIEKSNPPVAPQNKNFLCILYDGSTKSTCDEK